ncbi:MAG: hypothetical protein AAF682_07890 [Planctomycetota bacterium]
MSRSRRSAGRALPPLLCAAAALLAAGAAAGQARLDFELHDEPGEGGEPGSWRVVARVTGADPRAGALRFETNGWGWPDDGGYFELVSSDPPVAEAAEGGPPLALRRPPRWSGDARLVYRLRVAQRGSDEHQRFGLAPSRGDGFAYGHSQNTLLRPYQEGDPLDAEVRITLVAAQADGPLISGWAGSAHGRRSVVPELPWGNSPVVFGAPRSTASVAAGDLRVEVFQLTGTGAAEHCADLVRRLAPAMARATGWPARSPSRVFLSDAMGGGMGSDYGLHLNFPRDAGLGHERGFWFQTTLAHELFHEWLGVRLHESSGSLVWFREGFTEYFAQWFCAAEGITPRERFAETLEEFDRYAGRNSSFRRTPFARPGVRWRDGDGPNELSAYRGAPVLALALDVELRDAGHPGLLSLVRDLLARDEHVFPPATVREWFVAHGLEERWNDWVAGVDVPSAADSLRRAGFVPTDVPVDVAYLGLHTVEEKPIWRVLGVDPGGPAAKAGVEVGDVIDGFYPFNGAPTRLMELDTPYTFGLDIFTPGLEGSFLGVKRGDEKLQLFVEPELRPWGLRTGWGVGEGVDAFFSFEP